MTLIIYLQCTDATIIFTDRKQSNISAASEITKKYYIPNNEQFIFSMSGDADRIDTIVNELKNDQTINSDTIRPRLVQIMRQSPDFGGEIKISSGLLLVKINNSFQFHNVRLSNTLSTIIDENPRFLCYGEGAILADYLIRNFKPFNFDYKIALQYLIAIMNDVAERVDSVGGLEEFGFDIIVISNSNEIKKETIYEDQNLEKIKHGFQPSSNFRLKLFQEEKSMVEALSRESVGVPEEPRILKETADTTSISTTYYLKQGDKTYQLAYNIANGSLKDVSLDIEAHSLIFRINTINDGKLTITVPRELLDCKTDGKDDDFFALIDGEEVEFIETTTITDRTLEILFPKGAEEIEIIGTHYPIVIQTDKSVYHYGSEIIVTINNPYVELGKTNVLKIINEEGFQIYKKIVPVSEDVEGIYQEVIPIEGKQWESKDGKYKVIVEYDGKTASVTISRLDFRMRIEVDKKVYTWTETVQIALVASELNKNSKEIEKIGKQKGQTVTIETSKGKLTGYELIETGEDTGIFTGEVTLTGYTNGELNIENQPSGITNGNGPNDGRIACSNHDAIVVTITTSSKTISASALIRWNIGEIQWLSTAYPIDGEGIIRVYDPDMSLDPNTRTSFKIRVWSDTDPLGIDVLVGETDKSTGVFIGTVQFSQNVEHNKLRVSEGDTISAEYVDNTLPEPYSQKDELRITATTMIGTLVPPLEKMVCYTPRFLDNYDNELAEGAVGSEIRIITSVLNKLEIAQKFALLLQIKDERENVIFTDHVSESVVSKQSKQIEIKWTPKKGGKFIGRVFLWASTENPTALSSPVDFELIINPWEKRKIESSEKIAIHGRIFSKKYTVLIPKGTSKPGCEATNSCYIPSTLIVRVNQTVTWRNDDDVDHIITSGTPTLGPNHVFDSSSIKPRSSFAVNFKKKGSYPYFCLIHPWQTGRIIVQ